MQKWTKTKPNSPGYWWALDDEVAFVTQVITIWDEHSQKDILHCDVGDDYFQLSGSYVKNWLWGSSKLSEPMGENI